MGNFLNYLLSISLVFNVIFLVSGRATITVSSSNAYNIRTENGVEIYTWPLRIGTGPADSDGDAGNDAYCEAASLYPSGLVTMDPTGAQALTFNISTNTTYGSVVRYVHAEITNAASTPVPLKGEDNVTEYFTYFGDPNGGVQTVAVRLSDLCSVANVGTANCLFTPALNQRTIEIRLGVTEGQNRFCTTASTCATNNTTAADYKTILIELPRCASLNTSATHYSGGLYTYGLSTAPGDGRATVFLSSFPALSGSQYPYKSTLFLFEPSAATRTAAMTLAQATRIVEQPGGPSVSNYTVDGLTNDITYNVQVSFVNVGGFMTPPGPPNGATSAPQVTPSEIAGFLSEENACFIATAAYNDSETIALLRRFRGEVLLKNPWGRELTQWYYSWSPQAAAEIKDNEAAKFVVRMLLLPVKAIAAISIWVKTDPNSFWVFFGGTSAILFVLLWWGARHKKSIHSKDSK